MLVESTLVVVVDALVRLQDVVEVWWCNHTQLEQTFLWTWLQVVRRV
jgi:hypothetical protein